MIFVEQGRVGCEAWYRARRDTVTRWMVEQGKDRLIKARAAFVAHQRANGNWMTRQTPLVSHHEVRKVALASPIRDRRRVSIIMARHAAQHLRIVRNGGFIVSPTPDGNWWVGSRRMSPAQMLEFARSKGFDEGVVAPDGEMPVAAAAKKQRPCILPTTTVEWTNDYKSRWVHENRNADSHLGCDSEDLSEDLHPFVSRMDKGE